MPPITTNAAGQKYLRLEVPNYNHHVGSTHHPNTYLQLGAYPTDGTARARGDDLLDAVGLTTATQYYFKDDYRAKNTQIHPSTVYSRDDGYQKVASDPVTLTSQLRTRGGFRLHTDGNYISTTLGDRVDVIWGNYKMAVLGRLDLAAGWGETYWDSSGGHTRYATNTQGDRVMVQWNVARDRWRVYDETVKGDTIDRYQGIVEEIVESPRMISMIGSSDADGAAVIPSSSESSGTGAHTQTDQDCPQTGPSDTSYTPAQAGNWLNPDGRKKEKPDVTETTEADKMTSNTKVRATLATEVTSGGDTISGPLDISLPYAGDVDYAAGPPPLGAIVSKTVINETHSDKTYVFAGVISDTLTVEADVTIKEETGFAPSASKAGDEQRVTFASGVLLALGKIGREDYGTKTASNFGGWTFNFTLVALAIDISFGNSLETPNFAAAPQDFLRHQIGLTVAQTVTISIAATLDIHIGAEFKFLAVTKAEVELGSANEVNLLKLVAGVANTQMTGVVVEQGALDILVGANRTET